MGALDNLEGVAREPRTYSNEDLSALADELIAARESLAWYARHLGPIDERLTQIRYHKLGEYTSALLGSAEDWDEADYLEDVSERARILGLPDPGAPDSLDHYRKIADSLGIEYDQEDDE